ncbi:MAG: glycosyltransferase family 2 protein [Francisella endosymbiont of Hyalomma asiaticum]
MKKLISVVTVVYNSENLIERTIKSVIEQSSLSSIEFIIIDGNSSDRTLDIIAKYKNKIDIVVSEPDNGIYDAMNKAIRLASGVWINFMNAGDTFFSNETLELVIKKVNLDIDIFYGSRYILDEETGDSKVELADKIETISKKMPFGHQAAFAKTELLRMYEFNTLYRLSADYDFFIKCYEKKHKFLKLDLPICYFYEGGLTTTEQIFSFVETLKVLLDYFDENLVKNNVAYTDLLNSGSVKNRNKIKLLEYEIHKRDKEITSFYSDFPYRVARFLTYPINKYRLIKGKK